MQIDTGQGCAVSCPYPMIRSRAGHSDTNAGFLQYVKTAGNLYVKTAEKRLEICM